MSYRLEKQPNGKNSLIIDGWGLGMAQDPYSGINRLFGVNLNTPGEVSVGYPITQSTISGATMATPIAKSVRHFSYTAPAAALGSAQSYATLDTSGQVFESTSITGTWTYLSSSASSSGASNLDGICYWLGYLFKTRGANIDYWNGSTWTNGWTT